jgi:hypothetical protein
MGDKGKILGRREMEMEMEMMIRKMMWMRSNDIFVFLK